MVKKEASARQVSKLHMLKPIFARPYLAAALVGSFIHAGKLINYSVHHVDYWNSIVEKMDYGVGFAIIDVLLPYLVPFVVITVSKKLAKLREQEFYDTFPDLNPDIIIKCDHLGVPQYINTAAKNFMAENQIPAENIEALIPLDLRQHDMQSKNENSEKNELSFYEVREHKHIVGKYRIEYLISRTEKNEVFLSGRVRRAE